MSMIKVVTPFGVGFASSQEDLEKMNLFIEGLKAGFDMSSQAFYHSEDDDDDDDDNETVDEEPGYNEKAKVPEEFSSTKELYETVKNITGGSYRRVYNDERSFGIRRIKFAGLRVNDDSIKELKKKLKGRAYRDTNRSWYYIITDVDCTESRELCVWSEPAA